MREDILALCRAMGAGEEQDGLLLPLIEGASAELEHLLRRGVKPEDCGRECIVIYKEGGTENGIN